MNRLVETSRRVEIVSTQSGRKKINIHLLQVPRKPVNNYERRDKDKPVQQNCAIFSSMTKYISSIALSITFYPLESHGAHHLIYVYKMLYIQYEYIFIYKIIKLIYNFLS